MTSELRTQYWHYKLKPVLDYIHTHLHQDLKLINLANIVGISQYHFCRLFKQSIGVAPHQYIMQQRVERAKRLLQDQTMPLADITTACGFVDQSHFTKYFRQLTGSTPRVYRIQHLCMAS